MGKKRKTNLFASTTGRKKRKTSVPWKAKEIEERKELNTGYSWFTPKDSVANESVPKKKFAIDDYEVELSDDDCDPDKTSPSNWIISLQSLQSALNESAVCRTCLQPIQITETESRRAGLATTFSISCMNDCDSKSFETSPKVGRIHEVNKSSVLAARMIGKGRSGLTKLCSIMGLSNPVSKTSYANHTAFFEEKAKELLEENLSEAALKVKELELDEGQSKSDVVDIATCFDGTWSSRGWSARDGVVSAISEGTSQIVDVVYKTNFCRLCKDQEKAKAEGKISHFDYLMWYVKHEPKCLLNHNGSAQVSDTRFFCESLKFQLSEPLTFGKSRQNYFSTNSSCSI